LPWNVRYCDSPFKVCFFAFNRLSETGTCTVLLNHFVITLRLLQRSGKSSQWLYTYCEADPSGRAVEDVGLRPLAC